MMMLSGMLMKLIICGMIIQIYRAYPDIDVDNYVAVKRIYFYKPYKFETYDQYITIYVTKDLFNKIGTLEELTAKKLY